MIVADTNLLVHATQVTSRSREAHSILETAETIVAPLWHYEYCSALGVEVRQGRLPLERAQRGYRDAARLLDRELAGESGEDVLALSRRLSLSSYDAVFVYWALAIEAPADARLVNASQGTAVGFDEYLAART